MQRAYTFNSYDFKNRRLRSANRGQKFSRYNPVVNLFKRYWWVLAIAVVCSLIWGKIKAFFAAGVSTDKTNNDILDIADTWVSNAGYDNDQSFDLQMRAAADMIYAAMSGPFTNKEILRKYLTLEGWEWNNDDTTAGDWAYLAAGMIKAYGKRTLEGGIPLISSVFPEPEYTLPLAVMSELDSFDFDLRKDINQFFKPLNLSV